ncbi:MAG: HAMP domain-containing histidine kinase [Flavobacteriaceae bacterium]|nr:HAMP domain-containing histidine kinase [Flavobacteriaceae bacterium]
MKKSYRLIPYLITIVILATLAAQLYWSFVEYQKNSSNFKREIQQTLDVAIDNYFIEVSKQKNITLIIPADSIEKVPNLSIEEKILGTISSNNISVFKGDKPGNVTSSKVVTTIKISINKDSINLRKLKSLLNNELDRKEYDFSYTLKYYKKDTVFATHHRGSAFSNHFTATGKSTYLKDGEAIKILFPNKVNIILRKSLFGIFLSLFLMGIILFTLFYLLRVVRQQKQLSEIKNDLISNITHEFKTPIATIGAALESIRYFNDANDSEKTNRYIGYSNQQLENLGKMVDQLMDTALLDTKDWPLNRQTTNLKDWVTIIVENYKLNTEGKNIVFEFSEVMENQAFIDTFHLGNALGCLLDNAIKYGGEEIEITVRNSKKEGLVIAVSDNGKNLNKEQALKVFDKFYRVPQGNLHDIKGYGIGLYHVKKIAEKHHGVSKIFLKNNKTIFTISIPNE